MLHDALAMAFKDSCCAIAGGCFVGQFSLKQAGTWSDAHQELTIVRMEGPAKWPIIKPAMRTSASTRAATKIVKGLGQRAQQRWRMGADSSPDPIRFGPTATEG